MNDRFKKQVFEEELDVLRNKNYISSEEHLKVKQAYQTHLFEKQEAQRNFSVTRPAPLPKPIKILTPQEVRDRNITWILILGVIMVLLSGLIIATSAWDNLNNVTKTIGISFVAILFFAISWFAQNKLKIEKTAFAFWILGSLFLPVTVLSIGFFKLFGEYLSIIGEGKYLLGVIATVICLPVYVYSTKRYQNKLFAWISLTTLSLAIGFSVASFYPPVDVFYLVMIIYNTCLLAGYIKLKDSEQYKLFVQELPLFTQVNLIISTLLMLTFFKSPIFYGFNVMLTAILYILMVYAQGKKEYTYVFGGLLVYGIYQVVENSVLASVNIVIFALIGFIFLGLENYLKSDDHLKNIFRIISGAVSFCAFIYISVEGMIIRTENPSLLLLISYLLIALNYMYLAYKTEKIIFSYLAPIFLVVAGYQSFKLTETMYSFYGLPVHLFGLGVLMFLGLFVYNKSKFLKPLKLSSLIMAAGIMFIAIGLGYINTQWTVLSLMFFALGLMGLTVHKVSDNAELKTVGKWIMPVAWYLGLISYFPEVYPIQYEFEYSVWLVMSAVLLLALNEGFIRFKQRELAECFFCCSHIALLYALTFMTIGGINQPLLYSSCLLGYIYSVHRTKNEKVIRYSLYGVFTVLTITLLMTIDRFNISHIEYTHILILVTGLIFLLWYKVSTIWRKRIMWYLIPYSFIGALFSSFEATYLDLKYFLGFPTALISIAIALWIVKESKKPIFNILPLLALIWVVEKLVFNDILSQLEVTLIFAGIIFLIKTVGEKLLKKLYVLKSEREIGVMETIDWYAVAALMLIFQMTKIYQEQLALEIIPYLLLPYLLFSQVNRIDEVSSKRIVKTLTAISLLFPYYVVLEKIHVPNLIIRELTVLPWVLVVVFLSKKLWTDRQNLMRKIEYGVLSVVSLILIGDALVHSNAYEGIILGALSLASIIGGMQFKKKSFFFIGLGTLALNILITTRDYWGNMPWWAYLLGAGLVLIAVASLNEIEKNGGKKKMKYNKEVLLNKFKDWE